jgi:hypothetical protein
MVISFSFHLPLHPFFSLTTYTKYYTPSAKQNSYFLFLDNSSGYSREWFDKLIKKHNQQVSCGRLQLIKKAERYLFQLASNEKAEGLEPYYSKFGELGRSKSDEAGRPKSDPVIDYRIYRKE